MQHFYISEHPIAYCNFDDGEWCGWRPSYQGSSSGYWHLGRISTGGYQTGPHNDFTTMTSKGNIQLK